GPGDAMVLNRLLRLFDMEVLADADAEERLALVPGQELPFRLHPIGREPAALPEMQDDDLALEIAQLDRHPVRTRADKVRRLLADPEVPQLVQPRFDAEARRLTETSGVGELLDEQLVVFLRVRPVPLGVSGVAQSPARNGEGVTVDARLQRHRDAL